MFEWTEAPAVIDWLQITVVDVAVTEQLAACVAAANQIASRYLDAPAEGDPRPGDGHLGATMLAARLFRRRNSPEGTVQVTPDLAVTVARTDPDLARLLQIDVFAPLRVG